MKEIFYYSVLVVIPLAVLGWFLYLFGRAMLTLYEDWKLGKELDELQADAKVRRALRDEENLQRLANGCEHDFGAAILGLPPNACRSCGLERERPPGPCDHVWRLGKGAVPNSRCEKCELTYRAIRDGSDFHL